MPEYFTCSSSRSNINSGAFIKPTHSVAREFKPHATLQTPTIAQNYYTWSVSRKTGKWGLNKTDWARYIYQTATDARSLSNSSKWSKQREIVYLYTHFELCTQIYSLACLLAQHNWRGLNMNVQFFGLRVNMHTLGGYGRRYKSLQMRHKYPNR